MIHARNPYATEGMPLDWQDYLSELNTAGVSRYVELWQQAVTDGGYQKPIMSLVEYRQYATASPSLSPVPTPAALSVELYDPVRRAPYRQVSTQACLLCRA